MSLLFYKNIKNKDTLQIIEQRWKLDFNFTSHVQQYEFLFSFFVQYTSYFGGLSMFLILSVSILSPIFYFGAV